MKNSFFILSLIMLTFTLNLKVSAEVLPIDEKKDSLDNLILQDDNLNSSSELSIVIIKYGVLPYSFSYMEKHIETINYLMSSSFIQTPFLSKSFVGILKLQPNEKRKWEARVTYRKIIYGFIFDSSAIIQAVPKRISIHA